VGRSVVVEIKGAVVARGRKAPEKPKLGAKAGSLNIFSREKHDQWVTHHSGLDGVQEGVGPEERENMPNTRN
jgi:hypothetical protein